MAGTGTAGANPQSGGGAIDACELVHLGVPARDAHRLMVLVAEAQDAAGSHGAFYGQETSIVHCGANAALAIAGSARDILR